MMYAPIDHEDALRAVLDVVGIFQSQSGASDDDVVRGLRDRGYPVVDAERLNALVPSAFSWAMLRKLGMPEFPTTYVAFDTSGLEIFVPVASDHYFTAALGLAYETLEQGWSELVTRAAFEVVLGRSAEMDVANQMLNGGESLSGAQLRPLRVQRIVLGARDEG